MHETTTRPKKKKRSGCFLGFCCSRGELENEEKLRLAENLQELKIVGKKIEIKEDVQEEAVSKIKNISFPHIKSYVLPDDIAEKLNHTKQSDAEILKAKILEIRDTEYTNMVIEKKSSSIITITSEGHIDQSDKTALHPITVEEKLKPSNQNKEVATNMQTEFPNNNNNDLVGKGLDLTHKQTTFVEKEIQTDQISEDKNCESSNDGIRKCKVTSTDEPLEVLYSCKPNGEKSSNSLLYTMMMNLQEEVDNNKKECLKIKSHVKASRSSNMLQSNEDSNTALKWKIIIKRHPSDNQK